MNSITGHRHFVHVYVRLFFALLFYTVIGVFVVSLREQAKPSWGFFILFGFILIMAIYTILKFVRRAPSILINKDFIKRNSQTYYWADLEKIEFTGKYSFSSFTDSREGMTLQFKDQKKFAILDDFYSNISELKQFIKYQIIEKKDLAASSSEEVFNGDYACEKFQFYRNPQLLNFRGLIIWVYATALSIFALYNGKIEALPWIIGFDVIWIFGLSNFLHYFAVSEHYLVVRNHNMFWIKKRFRIKNIREIVFEKRYTKSPNSLRIITNDFKSEIFMAGTLWTKTWLQLKEDLEGKGITVRNESVFKL